MHGLHDIKKYINLKEKILLHSIFTAFVCGYLSTTMFIFFLAFFLTVFWKGVS